MSDLIERLRGADMSEESEQRDYEALNAKTALDLNKAQQEIERLNQVLITDHNRIAKLERVYEAATNLVRAEGWQIERDNLWDTLHDLIDAEDEAIADMEQT